MNKILFVASEANPFIKTGGLADVIYALPKILVKEGMDARIILPLYGKIKMENQERLEFIKDFSITLNWRIKHVGLFRIVNEKVTYYFIDNEFYFNRGEIYNSYGRDDEGEKYAYFNKAVLESIKYMDFKPDIMHLNDWHTGMIPLIYNEKYKKSTEYCCMKFVFTIHNLKYQGVFNNSVLTDLLEIDSSYLNSDDIEFYNQINFMKAGISFSDVVTTVSETYAHEITFPYFGEKLDGLLNKNSFKLKGIVNGIDYDENNPETDKLIYNNYNSENYTKEKVKNKLLLQKQMGLKQDGNIPMIGIVSRLTDMKGFDIIRHVFEELISYNIQFVLLGNGEEDIENSFRYFENKYPDKVRSNIMFSNELAHKIYSAADIYLMPSKFEPCGLSQLIALRYGTIPIVRETGGLNDTVEAYDSYNNTGNGFTFKNYNAHELLFSIQRALSLYNDKEKWNQIIHRAMTSDNSWKKSAKEYIKIYEELSNINS